MKTRFVFFESAGLIDWLLSVIDDIIGP